jgi:hypothetical protein
MPAACMSRMSRRVKNATMAGNKSEKSVIVAPILDLLYHLHCYTDGEPQLEVLDVSTTSIDPIDLCPYHENPEVWRILNKKNRLYDRPQYPLRTEEFASEWDLRLSSPAETRNKYQPDVKLGELRTHRAQKYWADFTPPTFSYHLNFTRPPPTPQCLP